VIAGVIVDLLNTIPFAVTVTSGGNGTADKFTMPANAVAVKAVFEPVPVIDTTQYITLWGKQTRYVSNFFNWILCIFLFGWIWMPSEKGP